MSEFDKYRKSFVAPSGRDLVSDIPPDHILGSREEVTREARVKIDPKLFFSGSPEELREKIKDVDFANYWDEALGDWLDWREFVEDE